MNLREAWARRARAFMDRHGLAHEHLLGARFAVNVFIAGTIVWVTLRVTADSNPIWAIASMVAACDPQPEEASRYFRSRLANVVVGCAVGFTLLVVGNSDWLIPLGLAIAVLISAYIVRIKVMWRQAPITAALIIAAGLSEGSRLAGMERGLHKVGEVIFGSLVGLLVSRMMSNAWLIRPPENSDPAASRPVLPPREPPKIPGV